MNITERIEHGANVFMIEGRVDTAGSIELDIALQQAVADGKHKMVLDLSKVSYISSAALRTLADVLTKNKAGGGDVKLVGLSERILRVFTIVGFDAYFSMYETVEAALTDF